MEGRFADNRVVVTGASFGIGAAKARQFAAEGACMVLVARRKKALEAMACEIGAARTPVVRASRSPTGSLCTAGCLLPRGRHLLRPWLEKRGRARKEQYIRNRMLRGLSQAASTQGAAEGISDLR